MRLTERMARAAELSRVAEWERAFDQAYEAKQAGTLDVAGFELVQDGMRAARDRYMTIFRSLKAVA